MSLSRGSLHPPEAPAGSFLHQHQEQKLHEQIKTMGFETTAPSEQQNRILERSRNVPVAESNQCWVVFSRVTQTPRPAQTLDLPPQCAATSEPLRCALRTRSAEKIAVILESDPDQAFIPFAGGQPPICEAIKCHCDLAVIDLLIGHGADPSMLDCRGRSALFVLASIPRKHSKPSWHTFAGAPNLHGPLGNTHNFQWPPSNLAHVIEKRVDAEDPDKIKWTCQVGERLLRAGCDPMEREPKGHSAEEVAAEYGWDALAGFIRQWKDFKVCLLLHRSLAQGRASAVKNPSQLASLNSDLKRCIYQFVLGSKYFT